jgi:hypothetical protein
MVSLKYSIWLSAAGILFCALAGNWLATIWALNSFIGFSLADREVVR